MKKLKKKEKLERLYILSDSIFKNYYLLILL